MAETRKEGNRANTAQPGRDASSSGPAKGSYAYAKANNPNIDKLIKERKGLTKGTPEYNAVQNKINKAYGKGPTTRPEAPKTEGPAKRGENVAELQRKSKSSVSSGSSSSNAKLATGVGSAAKAAAEAASKPVEKAKAVKKPSAGSRRAANKAYRQSMRAEKSRRRAEKFEPGGKKYVSSERLERESSRGPAGEARVRLYEEKRKRQAERRERRADIRDAKATGSRAKAAAKAQSGGKMKKYLFGGKVVAQGATKKDVRSERRQARKSGRKS